MRTKEIADEKEVLRMLTCVMRGEEEAKLSERCKAAEDLGKHYGLFDGRDRQEKKRPAVAGEIDAAIRELKRHEV